MYQPCSKCGNFNSEDCRECAVCGAVLTPPEPVEEPVPVPSAAPDWRQEIADRLAAYRSKRRSIRADASQEPFPFVAEADAAPAGKAHAAAKRARAESSLGITIEVDQPLLDFAGSLDRAFHSTGSVLPVASIRERWRAGALDALFLLLSYAGFLAVFRSFGGAFSFGRIDLLVYSSAFFLFYVQYFALFTVFAEGTPGERLRGLRVVNFDGGAPTLRQLLWRSFGYVLSGAAVLLGFLWALWDEDLLTWHDRVSQTYLTANTLPHNHNAAADELETLT